MRNNTPDEIMDLYQRICGSKPDVCTAPPPLADDSKTGPRLCGGNKPVFEKLTYTPESCKDLDKLAYTNTEERLQQCQAVK